jgi:hypothetical protein
VFIITLNFVKILSYSTHINILGPMSVGNPDKGKLFSNFLVEDLETIGDIPEADQDQIPEVVREATHQGISKDPERDHQVIAEADTLRTEIIESKIINLSLANHQNNNS